MNDIDVVAVVGTCGPERARYAMRLAAITDRTLFTAQRLRMSVDAIDEALALVPWTDRPTGAVVEFPGSTRITELIGALATEHDSCRLSDVVCVVDAMHLIDDLRRDTYAPLRNITPRHDRGDYAPFTEYVAHATLTVTQIEYASMIVLVNWEGLATPGLAALMALVHHLSPHARLRLDHGTVEAPSSGTAYTAAQSRPGWLALLNGEHRPHMTDPRISALRYEQMRPLHPERLERLLNDRIEVGEFGTVIRSAGFCRLATRPGIIGEWDHVGRMFSLEPLVVDRSLDTGDEAIALGQDIAFFGIDMHAAALLNALNEATLTDDELAAGPAEWATYPDPFPAWNAAARRAD